MRRGILILTLKRMYRVIDACYFMRLAASLVEYASHNLRDRTESVAVLAPFDHCEHVFHPMSRRTCSASTSSME